MLDDGSDNREIRKLKETMKRFIDRYYKDLTRSIILINNTLNP
jgi:hypothetical protein